MTLFKLMTKLDDIYATYEGYRRLLKIKVLSNNRLGIYDGALQIGEVELNERHDEVL